MDEISINNKKICLNKKSVWVKQCQMKIITYGAICTFVLKKMTLEPIQCGPDTS